MLFIILILFLNQSFSLMFTQLTALLASYGFTDIKPYTEPNFLVALSYHKAGTIVVKINIDQLTVNVSVTDGHTSLFCNRILTAQGFDSPADLKKILDTNRAFTFHRQSTLL
jgi:hypothetical protein